MSVSQPVSNRLSDYAECRAWKDLLAAVLSTYSSKLVRQGTYFQYGAELTMDLRGQKLQVRFPYHSNGNVTFQVLETSPLKVGMGCSCHEFQQTKKCAHLVAALQSCQSHIERGTNTAWDLLRLVGAPLWRRSLGNLQSYLQQTEFARDQDAEPEQETQSRLIFRVMLESNNSLELEFCEQVQKTNGDWSKGKILSLDRFVERPDLMSDPWAGAVAKALIKNRTKDSYGSRRYSYNDDCLFAAFKALCGCPHVFWAKTARPVAVTRGQLGIGIRPIGENLLPDVTVNGKFAGEYSGLGLGKRGALAFTVNPPQVIVAEGNERLTSLAWMLQREPTPVPPEGKDELLKLLPKLEEAAPVVIPEELVDGTVDGETRLFLKLSPLATGLAIELAAKPFETATWCPPGEGPAEVTAYKDQKRFLVRRNLAAEKAGAERIVEELGLNEYPGTGSQRWQIASDDETLDLLARLKDLPEGDPTIVWPADARPRKVVGEITPAALKVEIKTSRDWFGMEGTVQVGDVQVPLQSLLNSLRHGRRYVELKDGQWASISDEFRSRLQALDDVLHRNRNKLEFDATAAPVVADFVTDQTSLKVAKAWKKTLERLQRAEAINPQVPASLTAELRDYQIEGFKWLRRLAEWGVGGCLADDMGLGKTVQALAVLIDRAETGPALVVAPVSVGFNWVREVEKFAPTLRPVMYRDADRAEVLSGVGKGDLVVASYQLVQRDAERFQKVQWGTLVLDEAQFIKNARTKTSQVICDLDADWRVALTGTPLENHVGELWSIFRAVSPGVFGAWDRFRERFAEPVEKDKNPERRRSLSRTIRPFVLRRTKSEVLTELPQRTEIVLSAELSDAERKLYEDARLWAVAHLSGISNDKDNRFAVLAALTKLRQLACHPRLIDETWTGSSAKLDLLLETIDELRENKHRALVFSQFTSHLQLVREALDARQVRYQYLDGQTPEKNRRDAVDAFQKGDGELFLISLKAGGTGLNLTAADYVIHLDPWWNPAVEDQATDRAHRIGQTRPVTVYRLVAKDTIEEQIIALHGEKRTLVAGVLDGSDQAARLSTNELIDLIRSGAKGERKKVNEEDREASE